MRLTSSVQHRERQQAGPSSGGLGAHSSVELVVAVAPDPDQPALAVVRWTVVVLAAASNAVHTRGQLDGRPTDSALGMAGKTETIDEEVLGDQSCC